MRRALVLVLVLVSGAVLAADSPEDKGKDKNPAPEKARKVVLTVGKDLPGPFHPYNVTGPRAKNFACPVSAAGLHPAVLVLLRGDPDPESAPVKDLLQKLDNAVEKNPNVRLSICAVFVSDNLTNVIGGTDDQDDKRAELATKAEDLAKGAMLKHVVLAITPKDDLEAYGLPENAWCTVLVYHKYKIRACEFLEKDGLTPEKIQAIVTTLGAKLGATRK